MDLSEFKIKVGGKLNYLN